LCEAMTPPARVLKHAGTTFGARRRCMLPEELLLVRFVVVVAALMAIAFGLGWRTRKGR